jgi:hypothetical protein
MIGNKAQFSYGAGERKQERSAYMYLGIKPFLAGAQGF